MLVKLLVHAKEWFQLVAPQDEKAQGLIEYALIVLLIAVGVIVVLGLLGGQIQSVFQEITTTLAGAGAGQ